MTARWFGGKRLDTRRGFWFVWAPDALRPSKQYSSLSAAQVDAEALRARFPGREFLVYRAELVEHAGAGTSSPELPRAEGLGRPRLTLRRAAP